jgi:hypothetical protein
MIPKETSKRTTLTDMSLIMVVVLSLLGLMGIIGSLFFATQDYLERSTILIAARYSEVIREFRSLYAANVVAKTVAFGMSATHDFENRKKLIPLPATLIKILRKRLGSMGTGAGTRLYSDHLFLGENTGGPRDLFEKTALEELKKIPTKPYTRFETLDGKMVIRFATADIMNSTCAPL